MRNISINDVDHSPRGVLAIGTDYPPGHVLAAHKHRRAQFLFAVNGAMNVETDDGEWTVLPSNAVMIPAGVAHAVTMDGVSTRSLYIEPSAAPWFPVRCRVVAVSSLLRELLVAAVDLDVELNVEDDFPAHGRGAAVFQLILHELRVRSVSTLYESDAAIAWYLARLFLMMLGGGVVMATASTANDRYVAYLKRKRAERQQLANRGEENSI